MKRRFLTSAAAVALAAFIALPGAFAQNVERTRASMPPAKYDVPYTGTLTIWISSPEAITQACRTPEGKRTSYSSCAAFTKDTCDINVLKNIVDGKPFTIVDAKGEFLGKENLAFALRHEIAHCNGWPQSHAEGQLLDTQTPMDMPKLPESTVWLPAYPPVVCLTPDRKVEDCGKRKPNNRDKK